MKSSDHNNYYVYALLRDTTFEPFYIGYGCGDRYMDHQRPSALKRSVNHKRHIIEEMQSRGVTSIPKMKLAENLSKEDALRLEVEWIAKIKRYPNGPLVNATDGGEGSHGWSEEQRAKQSATTSRIMKGNQYRKGIPHTEETKALISAMGKGQPYRGDVAAFTAMKYGRLTKGIPKSSEHKEKISDALKQYHAGGSRTWCQKGKPLPEHIKEKIRASTLKYAGTPERRAKLSAALKGRVFSEETIAKMRESQQKRRARNKAAKEADQQKLTQDVGFSQVHE